MPWISLKLNFTLNTLGSYGLSETLSPATFHTNIRKKARANSSCSQQCGEGEHESETVEGETSLKALRNVRQVAKKTDQRPSLVPVSQHPGIRTNILREQIACPVAHPANGVIEYRLIHSHAKEGCSQVYKSVQRTPCYGTPVFIFIGNGKKKGKPSFVSFPSLNYRLDSLLSHSNV